MKGYVEVEERKWGRWEDGGGGGGRRGREWRGRGKRLGWAGGPSLGVPLTCFAVSESVPLTA